MASVAAAPAPRAKSTCEEICLQLESSEEMAEEAWEREMEAVLMRMRRAHSDVYTVFVVIGRVRRKLVHFAAQFGNRKVLEEGCTRTPGGPAEVAAVLDGHRNMLLHLAVRNKRLSGKDVQWLVSLNATGAGKANWDGNLPLHVCTLYHESLTPELVELVVHAHPEALQGAGQEGNLPLHCACRNALMAAPALRHLVSLNPEAASTANGRGFLPLHMLVASHSSLSRDLVDIVREAAPQAQHTPSLQGYLPLHCSCFNPHMTVPTLRQLASLWVDAAGISDDHGKLPLHLLLRYHASLTPELVHAVLDAFPQALQHTSVRGALPLHSACENPRMTADAFRSVLEPFPEAASVSDNAGHLPVRCLCTTISSTVRSQLVRMLMEATDALFPYEAMCCDVAAPASQSGKKYVLPPPEPHWASHKHPLSQQGRIKAGLLSAVRGRENVWQFQTGGGPLPVREVLNGMSLAQLVRAGHGSLVRQRLARSSSVNVTGTNTAVLRALELGHVDTVRDLLAGGSSTVQLVCTATQAVEWLGTLMRCAPLDFVWLVEWLGEQRSVTDNIDLNWLCLQAAALSGDLALVKSMAATWQSGNGNAAATDTMVAEMGARAVAGGTIEVFSWLQAAGLATCPRWLQVPAWVTLSAVVGKRGQLGVVELLHQSGQWAPGHRAVRAAAEHGRMAMLRWLHVHTILQMNAEDMGAAIHGGHAAVVHFLHRHLNVTRLPRSFVLAQAVHHSAPGTLHVVEYVLRHSLCGSASGVTRDVVVNACTATTVRVEVVRYLVSQASDEVLFAVEEDLAGLGRGQAQQVFQEARKHVARRLPTLV